MDFGKFVSELRRRNVYKVAVAYVVAGWALSQGIAQVLPVFDVPNWIIRLVVLLIIVGLPIALVLAWMFELTPEGLKRTGDADREMRGQPKSRAWIYIVVIGLIVSIGLFLLGRYTVVRNVTAQRGETSTGLSIRPKSIVVLPFENLSDDKNAAYFAEGIQNEILTRLASIAELKVISRTSTLKYKSKPADLKTVSQQLGVATVLEGTVQRAADKVRVNVQLIDARADSHLWAKSYDRELKDVFAVESEIAQEIADALQAKLSPTEANSMTAVPTQDPEAYDFFLKGEYEEHEAEDSLDAASFDRATEFYKQAIARDPGFALAIARLVESRLNHHWFIALLSEAELTELKSMAEHAIALAPNLAEAHCALGLFYYYGHRDYGPALHQFQRVLELQPNNDRALEYSGYVHRRQGQWEHSLSELETCERLDPRDSSLMANIAASYVILRVWNKGAQAATRALAIDPHDIFGMRALLLARLGETGDIKEARKIADSFPSDTKITTKSVTGLGVSLTGERAYLSVLERNFDAALKIWEPPAANPNEERQRRCARVTIQVLAGNTAAAAAEAAEARAFVESRLQERPNDVSAMTQLSWINLAQDRNDGALEAIRQAASTLPRERDALIGTQILTGVAEINARTRHPTEAIRILQQLLLIPAGDYVSIHRLKIDPVWDPIRNDPGFQQLLTGSELIGPDKK